MYVLSMCNPTKAEVPDHIVFVELSVLKEHFTHFLNSTIGMRAYSMVKL